MLISGCFKVDLPSETVETPQYSESDVVMVKYRKLLRENKSPEELIQFLKKNIKDMHENTANIAVMRLIDLQKKNLVKHLEKLEDKEYLKVLEDINDGEFHDIIDIDKRNWAIKLKKDGYILKPKSITIDYAEIKKITYMYVTDEIKDYIEIESIESEKLYLKNGDIIFIDKLAEMINRTLLYTRNYSDSPYISRVNKLKKDYLEIYLFGLPNSSAFEYYQGYNKPYNKIKNKWLKSYKLSAEKYKSYEFGVFISNYLESLRSQNFVLNKVVYDEIKNEINKQS
jgi:hypothetical protein